ncbi:ECF RNA polymerase sigma factor SigE [Gemmata sp. SH-PL17]|uniref:sigma-70 family RNA polymerase sigma factor n=1 Tax=Gemmata sp. SH-PL17 TaxID=1630693 RepID=UPI00078C9DC6|nr:sigma-70 family RNA polymerase sigma factor [Gemmata sp. SH-PL17]AMV23872.1 ECF RNA polymerase sigma factor SigE [Gemmata sp. SH-PL17]
MSRSAVALARSIVPRIVPAPDAALLKTFIASRTDDAFAELVRRYGPMVLAVCNRVLADEHDAEDAFQAVFIVLARKAGTIRGTNLAAWLHGVATRTAKGVRVTRKRRRKYERATRERPPTEAPADHELAGVIDEELANLSEAYREAIVLCELRGLSRKRAAVELGIPEGTLSSRLAGAKRKLAERLSARGLAPSIVVGTLLAPHAVSAQLLQATAVAVRGAAGSAASATAATVVKAMLFDQLRPAVLAAAVCLVIVCGGLAFTHSSDAPPDESAHVPVARLVADPGDLVKMLGSDDFAAREAAHKRLRAVGLKAEPALRTGLKSEDPEIRTRCAELLTAIRKDALDALVKDFDPAKDTEPDHPIWARFKTIAGADRAARALFAELIADPHRRQLLDAADRDPAGAGKLYAAEVKAYYVYVQKLWQKQLDRVNNSKMPTPQERPWADELVVLYLGTYSQSARAVPDNLENQLFRKWDAALTGPAGPAVRRVFTAWFALRDHELVIEGGLNAIGRDRVAEALPLLRKLVADEKADPDRRAQAILTIGMIGTRDDLSLLRRVAEAPAANKPHTKWSVILKGREELDFLWHGVKFGEKVSQEQWAEAWRKADVREGDRSLADCAWAAAVKLAGGKPAELGFLHPHILDGGKPDPDWFYSPRIHGFPDAKARAVAHKKAREWLDEKK